jgi:hypothetical protein
MFDNKLLITLVGLTATVLAINAIQNKNEETREDFGMLPSFERKVDVQVAPNQQAANEGKFTSVLDQYRTMLDPQKAFYTVPGSFQANITPRFFNGDYGANISYNLPSRKNLAVPETPLGFANAVQNQHSIQNQHHVQKQNTIKENFCTSEGCSTVTGCKPGGESLNYHGGAPLMEPGYAVGNYNKVLDEVYEGPKTMKAVHSSLPVGDMTTLNSLGEEDQPIIYDRYMFANRNSRLRSQGDKIRGDLGIVPNNTGWFNVSVQPNIDLEQGAMNVLGGINNETAQQLADLIYTTSGDSKTTIGGVNMKNELGNPAQTRYASRRTNTYRSGSEMGLNNVNMSNQYRTNLSAGGGDIDVVAYP